MKKMHIHLLIAMSIFLVMFIIGSFVDLQLNQALFSDRNGFGITVAAFAPFIGFATFGLMAGFTFHHALHFSVRPWVKAIYIAMSVIMIGVGSYFGGQDVFSVNGFNIPSIVWVGYLIALPVMLGAGVGGYFLAKQINNRRLVCIVVLYALFTVLALVIGTVVIKGIMHRPRYRSVIVGEYAEFHNWWQRCTNYKELIERWPTVLSSEEFKSFPSGHTSTAAITMMFVVILPFAYQREIKRYTLYFYLALGFTLFVAFSRMLVGAHFLTDVAMGGLITTISAYGCFLFLRFKTKPKVVQEAK